MSCYAVGFSPALALCIFVFGGWGTSTLSMLHSCKQSKVCSTWNLDSRLLVLRSLKKPVPRVQAIDVSFRDSAKISYMSEKVGKTLKKQHPNACGTFNSTKHQKSKTKTSQKPLRGQTQLTNIFQRVWNHQPEVISSGKHSRGKHVPCPSMIYWVNVEVSHWCGWFGLVTKGWLSAMKL